MLSKITLFSQIDGKKNIFSSKFIKYLLKVGKLFPKQFLKLIFQSLEFFFYIDI